MEKSHSTMKKYIFTILSGLLFTVGLFAQQPDSLLKRQMELEREFNPTLRDANKINSLPALREPEVKKASTAYSSWSGRLTPPLEIAMPTSGDKMTAIPFKTKRGYISLQAGNNANIDGAFGYRIVERDKNKLNFNFLHNSTNGNVEYLQESDPLINEAFRMDNFGKLNYMHLAESFTLNLHASYLSSLFNYYGDTFGDVSFYDNEKQNLGVLNARVGLESKESDFINYRGYVDFSNFNTKFGILPTDEGLKGNKIDLMVGLDKPFQDGDSKIGIDGKLLTVLYKEYPDVDDYVLLNASPYLLFEGLNWRTKLGVDALFQFSGGGKIRVVPNVELQLNITDFSTLYANIKGGLDDNTYLDMMDESRYLQPLKMVTPSFTILDIEGGVKIGEADGFRFDIFSGFKKTDDEHFLISNHIPNTSSEFGNYTHTETLEPMYGDLTHTHFGGVIHTNIYSPLDVALRVKKNIYSVKNARFEGNNVTDPQAWNLPGFEVDFRADYKASESLKFTLNYYMAAQRQSYFNNENVDMSNINDLNLGAIYNINDAFSINARANNVLSQKYDIWYGYPAQGFNAMGGFTFSF